MEKLGAVGAQGGKWGQRREQCLQWPGGEENLPGLRLRREAAGAKQRCRVTRGGSTGCFWEVPGLDRRE